MIMTVSFDVLENMTSLGLLKLLLTYQFDIGDYSHQRGCMTNQTYELVDCSCGLKEINHEIAKRVRGHDETKNA